MGKLIRQGSRSIKTSFEALLAEEHLITPVDEQIVYNQLDENETAIWSLLLASGYLKVVDYERYAPMEANEPKYELELTNLEVKVMFQNMIRTWFGTVRSDYNDFEKALLLGDVDAMNEYMNRVALETFSSFDTEKRSSGKAEPERFYHGFYIPVTNIGDFVKEGDIIGNIVNPLTGEIAEEARSPIDGLVFTRREYPVVYSGSLLGRVLGGVEE